MNETIGGQLAVLKASLALVETVPAPEFGRQELKGLREVRDKIRDIIASKRGHGRPGVKVTAATLEKGEKAYWMRKDDKTWPEIGEAVGDTTHTEKYTYRVRGYARTYARMNNLPWPIGRVGGTGRKKVDI